MIYAIDYLEIVLSMAEHRGRPKIHNINTHAIMACDTNMVGIPSQIAYGGCKNFVIPFHQGGVMPAI
jgi:hypothetical protein